MKSYIIIALIKAFFTLVSSDSVEYSSWTNDEFEITINETAQSIEAITIHTPDDNIVTIYDTRHSANKSER